MTEPNRYLEEINDNAENTAYKFIESFLHFSELSLPLMNRGVVQMNQRSNILGCESSLTVGVRKQSMNVLQ